MRLILFVVTTAVLGGALRAAAQPKEPRKPSVAGKALTRFSCVRRTFSYSGPRPLQNLMANVSTERIWVDGAAYRVEAVSTRDGSRDSEDAAPARLVFCSGDGLEWNYEPRTHIASLSRTSILHLRARRAGGPGSSPPAPPRLDPARVLVGYRYNGAVQQYDGKKCDVYALNDPGTTHKSLAARSPGWISTGKALVWPEYQCVLREERRHQALRPNEAPLAMRNGGMVREVSQLKVAPAFPVGWFTLPQRARARFPSDLEIRLPPGVTRDTAAR
jgi:hypothetical protein